MPGTRTFVPTGDAKIDALLGYSQWDTAAFTYSFPTSGSFYGSVYGTGENARGFEAFTAVQQSAVRSALAGFASVANVTFTEVTETETSHGDLRFAESNVTPTAWAYYPYFGGEGGDAWFNNSSNAYDRPIKGTYANFSIMHEIGHALGLKHTHEVEGAFPALSWRLDSTEYTVMSYRSYARSSNNFGYTSENFGYSQSLMMLDIAAVQELYGANYNTNSGDTVYAWSPTNGELTIDGVKQGAAGANRIFQTVWDGNGIDTYDFSAYATALKVDLQPGAWTTTSGAQLASLTASKKAVGNIANALLHRGDLRSLIENATGGAGADQITGNEANNLLVGNAGTDKLSGLAGDDRLNGGVGNDCLDGGAGIDTALFTGRAEDYTGTVQADGSWKVVDRRTGGDGTDILIGVERALFSDGAFDITVLFGGDDPLEGAPPAEFDFSAWKRSTGPTPRTASGRFTGDEAPGAQAAAATPFLAIAEANLQPLMNGDSGSFSSGWFL